MKAYLKIISDIAKNYLHQASIISLKIKNYPECPYDTRDNYEGAIFLKL